VLGKIKKKKGKGKGSRMKKWNVRSFIEN